MNRDPSHPSSKPNAFTLVELLVVIGIIVLLIGILLPAISRAMRAAHRTRIASDLNAISAALDAYKADFGDYPRIVYQDSSTYSGTFNGTGSGAETLGKALMGLGDAPDLPSDTYSPSTTYYAGNVVLQLGGQQWAALTTTTSNTPTLASKFWMPVSIPLPPSAVSPQPSGGGFDGADGPGFRLRPGGTGRVYGPYLQPDKFKTRGLAITPQAPQSPW